MPRSAGETCVKRTEETSWEARNTQPSRNVSPHWQNRRRPLCPSAGQHLTRSPAPLPQGPQREVPLPAMPPSAAPQRAEAAAPHNGHRCTAPRRAPDQRPRPNGRPAAAPGPYLMSAARRELLSLGAAGWASWEGGGSGASSEAAEERQLPPSPPGDHPAAIAGAAAESGSDAFVTPPPAGERCWGARAAAASPFCCCCRLQWFALARPSLKCGSSHQPLPALSPEGGTAVLSPSLSLPPFPWRCGAGWVGPHWGARLRARPEVICARGAGRRLPAASFAPGELWGWEPRPWCPGPRNAFGNVFYQKFQWASPEGLLDLEVLRAHAVTGALWPGSVCSRAGRRGIWALTLELGFLTLLASLLADPRGDGPPQILQFLCLSFPEDVFAQRCLRLHLTDSPLMPNPLRSWTMYAKSTHTKIQL